MIKGKALKVATNILFLCVGVFLMWYTFKDQDVEQIVVAMKQANYWWAIPLIAATFICHFVRALRWQQLVKALGKDINIWNAFNSLMFGYMVNYAAPRVGEFSRCMILSRKDKVPFTHLFGTVLSERMVDMGCLVVITFITLSLQSAELSQFYTENIYNPLFGKKEEGMPVWKMIAIGVLALFGIIYFVSKRLEKKPKAISFIDEVWDGLNALDKLKTNVLFYVYTLVIWVMYFFMTYIWFYALEESAGLGFSAGFFILVVGTIGKSVPIQGGGMGAYHYLVSAGLVLLGVSVATGNALAIIIHGAQTIFHLIFGLVATIILFGLSKGDESIQWSEVMKSDQT